MPVVITDFTNRTWCTEQATDGYLHAGYIGKAGPRVVDLLDFASTRQKQFDKFVAKKRIPNHRKVNALNRKDGKFVITSSAPQP